MKEIFYKIGEVSEMLKIEQHTLRYLESTLRLKIKRDERVTACTAKRTWIPAPGTST